MIDLQYYSPEEVIKDKVFEVKKIQVFVKRDDLIHPYISGNKWRKLKYVLRSAFQEGKNHLVTFGGAYSNHLLATACAAAKFGFKSTGIVRGEPVENDTLTLCRLFGMNVRFTDRTSYRNKPEIFDRLFGRDQTAFFINEGGSGQDAVKGCAELINELSGSYDHIFCACGTGTTAAGILKGILSNQLDTVLHAVPVFKDGAFIESEIQHYFTKCPPFGFYPEYHFGGYAKANPELFAFMQKFSTSTGILLDPVYTGKMFYALYDLIEKGRFSEGSKILAVHTGGLLGLLGMTSSLNKLL